MRNRERAAVILLCLDGLGVEAVGERPKTTPKRVSLWSGRFAGSGLEGLADKPGRGRKASIAEATGRVATAAARPPPGRRRRSIRSMSRRAGMSARSVQRVWSNSDLEPHRSKTFKLSNGPRFAAKVRDLVGLCLNPPDQALAPCRDEKSRCRALERTQRGPPLAPKRSRSMTHNDVRPGPARLFAALEQASGKPITPEGPRVEPGHDE